MQLRDENCYQIRLSFSPKLHTRSRDKVAHSTRMLRYVFRSRAQDHHQRAAPLVPSAGRGHDPDHLLSHGLRPVRPPGLHGRVAQQVCPLARPQHDARGLAGVST